MADLKLQFLLLICCVNNVFCKLSLRREDWTYTTRAFTFNGEECLSDCEYSQCVVHFSGEMKACYTTDELPFIFYTSRVVDRFSTECKSNCGYFGMEYQWCMTQNGIFDYCNSSPVTPTEKSVWNYTCIGPCTYDAAVNHYGCQLKEIPQGYCAPPASIRITSENTDDLKTSVTEKPQNSSQVKEKPVTQTCEDSTKQTNQNQCNCGLKYNREYKSKDIYFKIESNIPHEIVDKIQGNQYHFTINFDSTTLEKEKGNNDMSTEKPANPESEDIKEHMDKKPDENVSEHPSTNNQGHKESDEISEDMIRSNFGNE